MWGWSRDPWLREPCQPGLLSPWGSIGPCRSWHSFGGNKNIVKSWGVFNVFSGPLDLGWDQAVPAPSKVGVLCIREACVFKTGRFVWMGSYVLKWSSAKQTQPCETGLASPALWGLSAWPCEPIGARRSWHNFWGKKLIKIIWCF